MAQLLGRNQEFRQKVPGVRPGVEGFDRVAPRQETPAGPRYERLGHAPVQGRNCG